MRKIAQEHLIALLAALVVAAFGLAGPAAAIAQDGEIDEPTTEQIQESSGFEDEEGNPISLEEFEKLRKEETGLQWGNIALVLVIVAVLAAGLVWFLRSRRAGGGV